jgi:radical SAM protein with 4Fe4S-binding SPASM domain
MSRLYLPKGHPAGPFSGDKILWHAAALDALRRGEVPPPITVELDLTNACNLNCPYCTNAEYRTSRRESLNLEVAAGVISELADLGTKAVTFTGGGEPLLHSGVEQLIRLAQESGMDVALITNGVRLDAVDLEEIVWRLKWVRVSLDAWDQASYAKSKGKDHWETVVENIRALVAAKRQAKCETTVGLGFLTDAFTSSHFPEVARLGAKLGVDYVQARPLTFLRGDLRAAQFPESVNRSALVEARRYQTESFRVLASLPKYEDIGAAERGYTWCSGVYVSCVVGATGDVWICCHMRGNERFSLGNVRERPFADIWHDVDLRNEVYRRIGRFEECMPLCRFHAQNRLLARINWGADHVNFL